MKSLIFGIILKLQDIGECADLTHFLDLCIRSKIYDYSSCCNRNGFSTMNTLD